jgi:hypothetical protein
LAHRTFLWVKSDAHKATVVPDRPKNQPFSASVTG